MSKCDKLWHCLQELLNLIEEVNVQGIFLLQYPIFYNNFDKKYTTVIDLYLTYMARIYFVLDLTFEKISISWKK